MKHKGFPGKISVDQKLAIGIVEINALHCRKRVSIHNVSRIIHQNIVLCIREK